MRVQEQHKTAGGAGLNRREMPTPPVGANPKSTACLALVRLQSVGILALAALASGCSAPGVTIPREVRVAVPTPCIAPEDRPARPDLLSDGDILLLDSYRAVWALWGDRLERDAYERKLAAIVEGCSRISTIPSDASP